MKYIKTFEDISKKTIDSFILDFGIFISLNLSQVTKMGIDANAEKELNQMMKRLREPIINNQNYFELTKDLTSIYKNPKLVSALLNQIKELLLYIEPRIKKFVVNNNIKTKWLNKIKDFKDKYLEIIK